MIGTRGSHVRAPRTIVAGLVAGLMTAAIPPGVAATGCAGGQVWQQVGSVPVGSPFERLSGPLDGRLFVNRTSLPPTTDIYGLDGAFMRSVDGAVSAVTESFAYGAWSGSVEVFDSSGDLIRTIPGSQVHPSPDGTIYVLSGESQGEPVVTRYSGDGATTLGSAAGITMINGIGDSFVLAQADTQIVSLNADLSDRRPLSFSSGFDNRQVFPRDAGFGANDGYGFIFSHRETPMPNGVLVDDTRMDVFDLATGQLVSEILAGPDEWFPYIEFDTVGVGHAMDQTSGTMFVISGGTTVTPLVSLEAVQPSQAGATGITSGNGFIYAGLVGPHITVHDAQGQVIGSLDQSDEFVALAAGEGVVAVHDQAFTELDIYSATGELYGTFPVSFSNSGGPDRLTVADGHVYLTTDVEILIFACDTGFTDVGPSDYFSDAVLSLAEAGITSGVGDGRYAPYDTVTRAEMAAFIARSVGNPNPPAPIKSPFPDVPVDAWYAGYVAYLVDAAITSGLADGTYGPDLAVTRAEMAAFLIRALGEPEPPSPSEPPFLDVPVDAWYAGYVARLADLGLTTGKGDGTYGPSDPVIRGDMALFLVRAFLD